MKLYHRVILGLCFVLLFVAIFLNWKYEVIAFHPFMRDGHHELKVMTWNVHCSKGADKERQIKVAELILKEDADFVLLNEYDQDSCIVTDSLLRMRYPYSEECQSHRICGDIFYCKRKISHSGQVFTSPQTKGIQTIKATIVEGDDSVQIYGMHMASNYYDGGSFEKEFEGEDISYNRYKEAQDNRCVQAHGTKLAVLESRHPVIVMGDMNDFNCSAPLDTLTSCGLKDAWWEGGTGYGHTFHNGWVRLRIDHILHSDKLELESVRVIDTNLSDHNPLVAGFSLIKN